MSRLPGRLARDDPRIAVVKLLVLGSLAIVVLYAVAILGRKIIRPEEGLLPEVFALLDAGDERTLAAAWWIGGLLFAAALAAAFVARLAAGPAQRRREAIAWWVVACLFALLSVEIVSLHERGARLTGAIIAADSPLRKFGWLPPATVLMVLLGVVLIPAFRALPSQPRAVLIAGLATSIVGAAGMEAAYVVLLDAGAALRWQYPVMVIEEAAEIAGVLLILAGIFMAVQVERASGGVTLRVPVRGSAGRGPAGSRGRRDRGIAVRVGPQWRPPCCLAACGPGPRPGRSVNVWMWRTGNRRSRSR
jgi:hypothetical protein